MKVKGIGGLCSLVAVSMLAFASGAQAAPADAAAAPANDDVAFAAELGSLGRLMTKAAGTTVGATSEPNEPAGSGPATVWYHQQLKNGSYVGICVVSDVEMTVVPWLGLQPPDYDGYWHMREFQSPEDFGQRLGKEGRCPGDPDAEVYFTQFSGKSHNYIQVSGEEGAFKVYVFDPFAIAGCLDAKRYVKKMKKALERKRKASAAAKDDGASADKIAKLARAVKRAKKYLALAKEQKAEAC